MSLYTALQEVESHDFAARLGVANNLEMLFALAEQEQSVKELLALLQNGDEANRLLSHVISLLREQEDVRYLNSRDVAVAVCIWALGRTQPALARLLASEVLSAPRVWWARRAAIESAGGGFIQPAVVASSSYSVVSTEGWGDRGSQTKDVLIVQEPGTELIRTGQVSSPNNFSTSTDSLRSLSELPGEMTDGSSESETLTKVV